MLIQILIRFIYNQGRITKKLPIESVEDVSVLQQLIKINFGIPIEEQVLRFISSNFEVRIISGFSLDFYEIGNNTIIDLKRLHLKSNNEITKIPEKDKKEKNYNNQFYHQRFEFLNRLHYTNKFENLKVIIEDEDEEISEEDKFLQKMKEIFFDITKNNKTKEIDKFIKEFQSLSDGSKFSIIDNYDNVGWSGVHYAILFNLKILMTKLLEFTKTDFLEIISDDGLSPMFLAVKETNWDALRIMINYAQKKHCEIQTTKGSLLHEIFKNAPFDIIKKIIFEKKVDPLKKDFNSIKAIDVCRENIKEKVNYIIRILDIPKKPLCICGKVEKHSIFFGWMERYLRLNVKNRVLERYRKLADIPFKSREIISIKNIKNFEIVDKNHHVVSKKVYIKFFYDNEEHKYRVSVKEAKIWKLMIELTIKWCEYFNQFAGNRANNRYKKEIREIWEELDAGYEEFDLFNKEDIQKLKKKDLFPHEKKIKKVSLNDFLIIEFLGRGAFAKVYKVIHKKTKNIYAMKVLKKENLIKHRQEKYSKIEKKILQENEKNPYLLSLHYSFQDYIYLYMVVDFCPNGDLSILLAKQEDSKFRENVVKTYMTEILVALEDLHARNYIYRDLKPENILLDEDGYLKLADFGLAADNIKSPFDFAKSFCGSPIYLSPEILKNKKTYKVSDFYTFGVVMYELLTGDPPFFVDDINRLYSNIKKGNLKFPKNSDLSNEVKDLISKLMRNNPKMRLGAKNGVKEIQGHSFFKDVNWEDVIVKKTEPGIRFQRMPKKPIRKIIQLKVTNYNQDNEGEYYFKDFDYIRESKYENNLNN